MGEIDLMSHETVWALEPHTLGKHKVLRAYLDAWLPIMASWNGRILFIDGFAGPGEYKGGEHGSPVIALNALREHTAKKVFQGEIGFIFIEKEQDRVDHLESVVAPLRATLPPKAWIEVNHGTFDETMTEVLDQVDAQLAKLAPAFVMVDPFGVSGTPMSVLRRIMRNERSEAYVSFMYESINRFATTPEFQQHLDELFGTQAWRQALRVDDPTARRTAYYEVYEQQLRDAGAKHVVKFELYEGNRLVYAIFFATHHELGSDRMKKAIWGVAPWGDFKFRPSLGGQLTLGLEEPDLTILMDQITYEFHATGWTAIEEIERFVQSDKTPFHSGHLKRGALVPMETDGRIQVDESSRKRKNTYPPGTRIRIT
jgi:three-Cys-motif partner protein